MGAKPSTAAGGASSPRARTFSASSSADVVNASASGFSLLRALPGECPAGTRPTRSYSCRTCRRSVQRPAAGALLVQRAAGGLAPWRRPRHLVGGRLRRDWFELRGAARPAGGHRRRRPQHRGRRPRLRDTLPAVTHLEFEWWVSSKFYYYWVVMKCVITYYDTFRTPNGPKSPITCIQMNNIAFHTIYYYNNSPGKTMFINKINKEGF